jgi:restriction endonuclease S subunit
MNTPDLVGEVGFVDSDHPDSFLPDRLWAASVSKGVASARWLSYVLSSSEYKQKLRDLATGTSGSMKNISKGAFLGLPLQVPTLEEQSAIAQILSDMDAELAALEARRDKTKLLKQGMMQALLTGRIRLM